MPQRTEDGSGISPLGEGFVFRAILQRERSLRLSLRTDPTSCPPQSRKRKQPPRESLPKARCGGASPDPLRPVFAEGNIGRGVAPRVPRTTPRSTRGVPKFSTCLFDDLEMLPVDVYPRAAKEFIALSQTFRKSRSKSPRPAAAADRARSRTRGCHDTRPSRSSLCLSPPASRQQSSGSTNRDPSRRSYAVE
jgi:hypothetical protein